MTVQVFSSVAESPRDACLYSSSSGQLPDEEGLMAPITSVYGITGSVPFLDVDVTVDNKWFLDPRAIRLHQRADPFAVKANECTETFFEEVLDCVARGRRPAWTVASSAVSRAMGNSVGSCKEWIQRPWRR